jgi:leucyl aminopeptidase (aminopeptidase T)
LKAIDPSALVIAEFGIGLNPKATSYTGYALFDEKLVGTCHIALGTNQYFGGANEAPVHFDFISTPSALNYK